MSTDPSAAAPVLLALAGLTPSKEETAGISEAFAAQYEAMQELYAVADARYEEPALIFRARP
ncbi:hypothetical protein ACPA54_02605 [Uniformispora flossi]|uniref:hypothetical protein n=1 Tax=Uniformispora flossi TaxID=3390723 RepID=UPI003C2E0731